MPVSLAREFLRALVRTAEMPEIDDHHWHESGRHFASLYYWCGSYTRGPINFESSITLPSEPYSPP